jgi:hypothetical protein
MPMSDFDPQLSFQPVGGENWSLIDNQNVEIRCRPVAEALTASLTIGDDIIGAPSIRLGEEIWRWEWNPRGRAGTFEVRLQVHIHDSSVWLHETLIQVRPSKLEPVSHEALLQAIQRVSVYLVFALHGGTLGVRPDKQMVYETDLVEQHLKRLQREVRYVGGIVSDLDRDPALSQRVVSAETPIVQVRDPAAESLARVWEQPVDLVSVSPTSPLARLPSSDSRVVRRVPRSLSVRRTVPTSDTYEHRALSHLLEELLQRCTALREALAVEIAWNSAAGPSDEQQAWLERLVARQVEVDRLIGKLKRSKSVPFLDGVPTRCTWRGPSERMLRDRRYRRVGRLWHLIYGQPWITVRSPAYDLPVGDMPRLYELWCLLEVARTLVDWGVIVEHGLINLEEPAASGRLIRTWRVRVPADRPLLYVRDARGTSVRLWYERRFRPATGSGRGFGSLDPFVRIPDIVVEVTCRDKEPAVLVFDAKYRVSGVNGIPEEALGDAYTYRHALGFAGKQVCRGAYLLFPGSVDFIGTDVGAISLLPGNSSRLDELLRYWLRHYAEPAQETIDEAPDAR